MWGKKRIQCLPVWLLVIMFVFVVQSVIGAVVGEDIPSGDSTKDPLVNESKVREILLDEKADIRKKKSIVELYGYKQYAVSPQLALFLVEQMRDRRLTDTIMWFLMKSGHCFDVDAIVPVTQDCVDNLLQEKNFKGMDRYMFMLKRFTPATGASDGHIVFWGNDKQLDDYQTSLWRKSDDYLSYCITYHASDIADLSLIHI